MRERANELRASLADIAGFEVVMEGQDMRAVVLSLAAGQSVPWHYHSDITDSFVCLVGPVVVETRAAESDARAYTRPTLRSPAQDRSLRSRTGWWSLQVHGPTRCWRVTTTLLLAVPTEREPKTASEVAMAIEINAHVVLTVSDFAAARAFYGCCRCSA